MTRAGRGVGLQPERECASRCPVLCGACGGARGACTTLGKGMEAGSYRPQNMRTATACESRPDDSLLDVRECVLRETVS